MKLLRFIPIIIIFLVTIILFRPFILHQQFPIPADTIIGLYHPFRDLYAATNPRGVPYHNFLITDPVRQQYPWKSLSVLLERLFSLPLWNPYQMAGVPLLGNFQSSVFYPLNLLLLILPLPIGWSLYILLQPLFAGVFMYLYLCHLRLQKISALMGSLSFMLCGFSVAWLEWGTIIHTALWLPLCLLCVDKIISTFGQKNTRFNLSVDGHNPKFHYTIPAYTPWSVGFVLSVVLAFFAGHLQTFFYLFLFITCYIIARLIQRKKSAHILLLFISLYILFFILTVIQWLPTLQFILLSARGVDQVAWQKEGWFLPWQHLVQFIIPDFFGNPTTLNYWGVWNYGELVGYIGIIPFLFALIALCERRDKRTFFFGSVVLISLLFALPTPLAKLPYLLNLPFLATAQPTRLLFLIDFALCVLAALGCDVFLKKSQKIWWGIGSIGVLLALAWIIIMAGGKFGIQPTDLAVAKRNMYLPTLLFLAASFLMIFSLFIKEKRLRIGIVSLLLLLTAADLLRFAGKFETFSPKEYLFPPTRSLTFLQNLPGPFRIMSTDSRIFPPNFPIMYHLESIEGYDPLYLQRFGELMIASERKKPDISPPFGFNRIITPHNVDSRVIDLMGVKYVLSLSGLTDPKLKKVFTEGQTQVYENTAAYPRAFFVTSLKKAQNKKQAISTLFNQSLDLHITAVVENGGSLARHFSKGKVEKIEYKPNKVDVYTKSSGESFLVLTDTYYPSWDVTIYNEDGSKMSNQPIYITDYNFRGVVIPAGQHRVEFTNHLF